ncbi:hypothetical protein [Streptomyces mayteni]
MTTEEPHPDAHADADGASAGYLPDSDVETRAVVDGFLTLPPGCCASAASTRRPPAGSSTPSGGARPSWRRSRAPGGWTSRPATSCA